VNGKEYITIMEMAERLGKKPNAVKQLLYNAGIKPVSREALYELEAFEAIKNAPPPGRPKRATLTIEEDDLDKLYEKMKAIHERTKNTRMAIRSVKLEPGMRLETMSPSDKKRFGDLINEITELNELREKSEREALKTPENPRPPSPEPPQGSA